ncbi:MAG: tetratricopeptide repeat protein, partial [Prosthecobacter sp.]|nr:tetratricopeptide repeat protein [Prosthecobacter sp.]
QKIVKDAPTDVEQQRLLASAYQAREDYAKAVPHLEAAIQIGGGDADDYLALGELLLRSQLYEKAIQLSQRSAKLFPDQAMFHVQAAVAHRSLQHMEPAIASFAEAAELAEANQSELINYRFYYQYGITLERGGRHDEAGRILEKSITLTPKDDFEEAANTMNYLGYMWLELDRYLDKAGELIQKANQLHPENPAYIDSLGWWHFKKGDYPNALKELQRAISLIKELQPEDAEIVEHLALVYLKLNDPEKARENLIKARDLQPKDEKVRRRIEESLKKLDSTPKP